MATSQRVPGTQTHWDPVDINQLAGAVVELQGVANGGSLSAIGAAIKAGLVGDGDFAAPVSGSIGINTNTKQLTWRSGTTWVAALTYAVAAATQSPIQSVADSAGRWPNGTVAGNAASYGYSGSGQGVYFPGFNSHHQFTSDGAVAGAGNAGVAIRGSLQLTGDNAEFFGPTQDDSAQGANVGVFMKNPVAVGGIAYTQTNPVVANEFDVQIENNVTVSGTYMSGAGSRHTIIAGATITTSPNYGFKSSLWTQNNKGATTYGAAYQWRAFYDDLYNPAGSAFDSNVSLYGLNQIVSEQGFALARTSYGGSASLRLHGSGGSENSLLSLTVPNPATTTSVADGGLTSGSNLMTTATVPSAAWIGRVLANANIPAGTQVLNFYGTGPYTLVMTANASGTASSQTVTITEPDLTALRINMASGQATGNALSIYDTTGSQRLVVSRAGALRTVGVGIQAQNGSGQSVVSISNDGSVSAGTNVSGTGALGAKVWSGSGAPGTTSGTYPGGTVAPSAGDFYLRKDTPSTANQRIYVCTTGGATPVWTGVV